MDFGKALEQLKKGYHMFRLGWNGKDMFIFIENEKDYKETVLLQHIVMKTVKNTYVPWLASQTDILAEDWDEVSENVPYTQTDASY